jgi:hypothetical protein
MEDADILARIRELVAAEHEAREPGSDSSGSLAEIEATLDQCWDLLRQRRAKREFGEDPDDASARSEGTVEHYRQ